MEYHKVFDVLGGVVISSSLLYSVLPPFESFNFAPRFQLVYRVFLVFLNRIGALNLRSLVLQFYSSYQGSVQNVQIQDSQKQTSQVVDKSSPSSN